VSNYHSTFRNGFLLWITMSAAGIDEAIMNKYILSFCNKSGYLPETIQYHIEYSKNNETNRRQNSCQDKSGTIISAYWTTSPILPG
jgi:hypothetical protein